MKTLFICANQINSGLIFVYTLQQAQGGRKYKLTPPSCLNSLKAQRGFRKHPYKALLWALMMNISSPLAAQIFDLAIHPESATSATIMLTGNIDEYDGIYHDYFSVTIDNPHITLSKPHWSIEPSSHYVESFKAHKDIVMGPCSFTAHIDYPPSLTNEPYLYVTYQLLSEKYMRTELFALTIGKTPDAPPLTPTNTPALAQHLDTTTHTESAPVTLAPLNTPQTPIPLDAMALALASAAIALLGLALIARATYAKKCSWRRSFSIVGMALIACSVVLASRTYQARDQKTHLPHNNQHQSLPIKSFK